MKDFFAKLPFLTLGALIAAASIELFLVPNTIIDGGVVGISIMCSYLTDIPLGIFTFVFNLPFLVLAYKKLGKKFVLSTLYAVSIMSIAIFYLHPVAQITKEPLLATVFGGSILGLGVGLVLKAGGSLDGTEILSIGVAKKINLSVGQMIMGINIIIFTAAGFVFSTNLGLRAGAEKSMLSILTYFLASKVIDMVLEGVNEAKSVRIISDYAYEIGNNVIKNIDTTITYIDAIGGYSQTPKKIVYCVISRIELSRLKDLVKSIDPNAFIAIENIHEVEGRRFKKSTKTF